MAQRSFTASLWSLLFVLASAVFVVVASHPDDSCKADDHLSSEDEGVSLVQKHVKYRQAAASPAEQGVEAEEEEEELHGEHYTAMLEEAAAKLEAEAELEVAKLRKLRQERKPETETGGADAYMSLGASEEGQEDLPESPVVAPSDKAAGIAVDVQSPEENQDFQEGGYSSEDLRRDIRGIASFAAGAAVCCFLVAWSERGSIGGSEATQRRRTPRWRPAPDPALPTPTAPAALRSKRWPFVRLVPLVSTSTTEMPDAAASL
eukprot:TRINITY_DN27798_c0_g1_i1.p1 TRINITY_DN27798_c0_g1~~TRINITY_DN27798_c0_g1_i1.p1  ORF type:complete len:262 (+),score=66.48 TRINITY_DN27798_c0_g1_i1:122-907(+)